MIHQAILLPLLPAPPAGVSVHLEGMWESVRSLDGHSVTEHLILPELPQRVGKQATVAIVPTQALSWHRVTLPAGTLRPGWRGGSAARLRTVLEGLLEDQLLEEPANLHFALAPGATQQGTVWVAVCQRQWLQNALAAMAYAGHTPEAVVPEWVPGNGPTNALWCTGGGHDAQWVWTDAQGVHRRPWPSPVAPHLPPDALQGTVWAEPGVAALAETALQRDVEVMSRAQRLLNCTHTDWNLAQGELAPTHAGWGRIRQALQTLWQAPDWRPARWAALVLVLTQLVGLQAYAWWAEHTLAQGRSTLHSLLQTTFPATTVVVDAPLQMERAVAALRQSSGSAAKGDLESMLAALGGSENFEPLMHTGSAQAAMEFAAGELRVSGLPLSPEPVDALRRQLADLGYTLQADGNSLRIRASTAP